MTLEEQDVMLREEAVKELDLAKKYLDGSDPQLPLAELSVRKALQAVIMVPEIDGSTASIQDFNCAAVNVSVELIRNVASPPWSTR